MTEERTSTAMANSHHHIRPNALAAPGMGKPIAKGASRLVIEADQCIVGDVSFSGTVQIDGRIEGDVSARRVVVSPGAVVDGTVKGRSVYVDGTVNGAIDCGAISLASTASVKGDITYETMTIASGASIVGLCCDRNRMNEAKAAHEPQGEPQPLPFHKIKMGKTTLKPRALEAARPATPSTPQAPMTMRAVWDAIQETDKSTLS